MSTSDRPLRWYQAAPLHAMLLVGAVFFVLPLVWMIATSLKPLEQTMKVPDSVGEALLGTGHRAVIDGAPHEVALEREIVPSAEEPFWIVRPLEPFPAGEMTHPFGPEVWRKFRVFNESELARMEASVTPAMKVLADRLNPFDPGRGVLRLQSGREVAAKLVRRIAPAPGASRLWLVRQWRPEDTDTKEIGSTSGDITRAWAVVPESEIRTVVREIPQNYPAALRRVHFGRSLVNTICFLDE